MPQLTDVEKLEATFKTWIEEECFTTKSILIALHNVCFHGEIFEKIGYDNVEENLEDLFYGFDKSIAALKKIQE